MITKSDLEKYLGITIDDGLSGFITTVISGVSQYIKKTTGRNFESADTNTTRYYDGNGGTKLAIDDLREITSLKVWGVTLTKDTDYYLSPANATEDGIPYTTIELIQPSTRLNQNSRVASNSPYVFDEGQRGVEVTGKFGYSTSAPADIKLVALKLAGGVIKENIGDNDVRELTNQSLGDFSASYTSIANIAHALKVDELLKQYVRPDGRGVSNGSQVKGGSIIID